MNVLTDLQNSLYHPQVSHATHSSRVQSARFCQPSSVSTASERVGGPRDLVKPSKARDSAPCCSFVRLSKAFLAVLKAGLSSVGASSA